MAVADPSAPDIDIALSVIVRIVGAGEFLHRCLEQLVPQIEGRPIEVIVPCDARVTGIAGAKRAFPRLTFLDMPNTAGDSRDGQLAGHDVLDRRSSAGFHAARGRILAHLEDYGSPCPDWCDQILEAHNLAAGAIGGAVEHQGTGALNWAIYFLDFGRYGLPLAEGAVGYLTDVNISYKRAALASVQDLWADRYNEATVNWALARGGVVLWLRPQIVVHEDRGTLSLRQALPERYHWGRLFACRRVEGISPLRRLMLIAMSPALPLVFVARIAGKVFTSRTHRKRLMLCLPHLFVCSLVWSIGELAGYITGRESSAQPAAMAKQ